MPSKSTTGKIIFSRCFPLVILLLIAVASAWLHLRVLAAPYSHPDEEIARAVVSKVLREKSADTNWIRTDVIPAFHYNQFNFSLYYLSAAHIEKLSGNKASDLADRSALISHLRMQNIAIGALSVLLAGLLAMRIATTMRGISFLAGVVASILTACCVTLFQDDIYGRPEAFVTALTILYVFVLTSEKLRTGVVLTSSGLILGLLLATKITFAVFLPFPLLAVATRARSISTTHPNPWTVSGAVAVYFMCVGVGFGIGAPYALKAPWEYLEGLSVLFNAYNGDAWSDLQNGADPIARTGHGIAYLVYTQGVVSLILSVVGLFTLVREHKNAILFALAGPLLTLFYFLQVRAFFERNFSHVLPILFVLAGIGCSTVVTFAASRFRQAWPGVALKFAIAAVLIGFAAYPGYAVSARLFGAIVDRVEIEKQIDVVRQQVSRRTGNPVLQGYHEFTKIAQLRNGLCGQVIYEMMDFGDDPKLLSKLSDRGYRLEEIVRSPFDGAPLSTLQQYHSANILFLRSPTDPPDKPCLAEIVAPALNAAYLEIPSEKDMPPSWTLSGHPSELSLDGWPHPFYASWSGSDANTGELVIGPFEACGEFIVPYATGPVRSNIGLKIERTTNDLHEVITQGPPPLNRSWAAIRVLAAKGCAQYTIHASDHGSGWGEWLGIGVPVEVRTSNSSTPSHDSSTSVMPDAPIERK